MKVENRIVCFIDILGFSSIVEEFERTRDISIIEKIKKAFDESLGRIPFNDPKSTEITKNYYKERNISQEQIDTLSSELVFKSFSDNIIISMPFYEGERNFLARLNLIVTFSNIFQYAMTSQGVYTRGGISYGSFYFDENIIFSKALINAYELEKNVAKYPRIVIDQEIIKLLAQTKNHDIVNQLSKALYLDWENVAFISPLSFNDEMAIELEETINSGKIEILEKIKKELKGVKGIEYINFMNPYQHVLEQNGKIVADLQEKLLSNQYSDSVKLKYAWVIEFYKWKYSKETTMLKFKTLYDTLFQ